VTENRKETEGQISDSLPPTRPLRDVKLAGYEVHPLALAIPQGTKEELEELTESIRTRGQLFPVFLYEGKILDGRRRAWVCDRFKIALLTTPLAEGVNPIDFVVAANLHRRHLNPTQRAVAAMRLVPFYAVQAAERKRVLSGTRANPDGTQPEVTESLPEPDKCGEAREHAARATGANARYVSDLLTLQREAPNLFAEVEAGTTSIPKALRELERQKNEGHAQKDDSARNAFLAVLWDDGAAPPSRAPEKSYPAKNHPNMAFFRLHAAGDTTVRTDSKHGLAHAAIFAVPVDERVVVNDNHGRPICKANCRFLTLSVRGDVPGLSTVPTQLIPNGFEGVTDMVQEMFPHSLKVLSSSEHDAPPGWQHVPRHSPSTKAGNASDGSSSIEKQKPTTPTTTEKPARVGASSKAAKTTKPLQKSGQKKRNTVQVHLSKVRDELHSIATEWQKSELVSVLESQEAREAALGILQPAIKRLEAIINSSEVAVESIDQIHFTTRIVPHGPKSRRIWRTARIADQIIEVIGTSAPKTATELKSVFAQLRRIHRDNGRLYISSKPVFLTTKAEL
jgi:hypothetical protein